MKAVLTDIEGTTSSIAFVAEVLFPYARARLADYVVAHQHDLHPVLAMVPGLDPIETLLHWSDEDVKAPPLKEIQGRIWADGYATGAFTGHVYADAVAGLRRWHGAGVRLYVFSSGSVAAQRLLFGHSDAGDLTPLFSGYFDTTTGPKREAASYARIAGSIGEAAEDVLFLSDTPEEIAAARAAGMAAALVGREGEGEVASFDDLPSPCAPAKASAGLRLPRRRKDRPGADPTPHSQTGLPPSREHKEVSA